MKEVKHHKQQTLCQTRPAYRQGRRLTAVKTYTIASESQHLFVYGVPKLGLQQEFKSLVCKSSKPIKVHVVADHKTEIFTECFHVVFQTIEAARRAKRFLDNRAFYGGILHVCYAPEFETVDETQSKLQARRDSILCYKE